MNLLNTIRKVFGISTSVDSDNIVYDRIVASQNLIKGLTEQLSSNQESFNEIDSELQLKLQACDAMIDKGEDSTEVLFNKLRLQERIESVTQSHLEENVELTKSLQQAIEQYETLQKSIEETVNGATDEQQENFNSIVDKHIEKGDDIDLAISIGLIESGIVKATEEDFKLRHEGIVVDYYQTEEINPFKVSNGLEVAKAEEGEESSIRHSVAVIVRDNMGKILFLQRSMDDDLAPGTWCLPGGGIDEGETPVQAAVRELKEEANIDLKGEETSYLWLRKKVKVESGKIIYYFDMGIPNNPDAPIALLDGESTNYAWWNASEYNEQDLILDLKSHLKYLFNPNDDDVETITIAKSWDNDNLIKAASILKEAFSENINYELYFEVKDALEKGKPAQLGEERIWGGHKYKKTATGWVPVGDPRKAAQKDDPKDKGKKKDQPKPGAVDKSGKTLEDHAKSASENDLKKVVATHKDEHMRSAAKTELDRRAKEEPSKEGKDAAKDQDGSKGEGKDKSGEKGSGENKVGASAKGEGGDRKQTLKQAIKDKLKNWNSKQREFYAHGGNEPHSQARSSLANFMRKKAKGIVEGIKHEVHEWKDAGKGLKKLFTGKKAELTDHEKKAMKTLAIHLALTVGMMAATGGISGLIQHGAAGFAQHLATHYLEHAGVTRIAHALLFASMVTDIEKADLNDMTPEDCIKKLVQDMINYMESGAISDEDWQKLSEASNDNMNTIYG